MYPHSLLLWPGSEATRATYILTMQDYQDYYRTPMHKTIDPLIVFWLYRCSMVRTSVQHSSSVWQGLQWTPESCSLRLPRGSTEH